MILSEATISGQWGGSRSICSVPAVVVVGENLHQRYRGERQSRPQSEMPRQWNSGTQKHHNDELHGILPLHNLDITLIIKY